MKKMFIWLQCKHIDICGGFFMANEKVYMLTLENDNSLKQLFDRFYVIPKESVSEADKVVLTKYSSVLANKFVATGKNGYIVFRGKKPKKLTDKQIDEIKSDSVSTQRELAFKYNCSHATINKIKKDKY